MPASSEPEVAIVTGASSGIGRELVRELLRQGWKVGAVARREDRLQSLRTEVEPWADCLAFVVADVTDRPRLGQAFAQLEAQLGPTDLLIANAGIGGTTEIAPTNLAETEQLIRVNFLGVVYSIDAVVDGMVARGKGQIAAISSLAAFRGLPGSAAYCATKAAVNTYLEGLRIPLARHGIRVTTICPGFVESEMTAQLPRRPPMMLKADDAARRIVKAIRQNKKVYCFPWLTTRLVRLATRMPDWLLQRLYPPEMEQRRRRE